MGRYLSCASVDEARRAHFFLACSAIFARLSVFHYVGGWRSAAATPSFHALLVPTVSRTSNTRFTSLLRRTRLGPERLAPKPVARLLRQQYGVVDSLCPS
jgi:hypothetical protein